MQRKDTNIMLISSAQIEQYFLSNKKYFAQSDISGLKAAVPLSNVTLEELNTVKFKSPTTAVILSVLLGWLGADRFYSGNYVMAIVKLITAGCCGIWWIIDWFLIGKKIKEKNAVTLNAFLSGQAAPPSVNIDNIKKQAGSKEFRSQLKGLAQSYDEIMRTMETD